MGVLGGLALAAAVWWGATRLNPASVPQQVRFTIVPPSDRPLNVTAIDPPLAISPDGTHIVYSARLSGETQMMLRNIDAVDAVPVPGSINSRSAFFSPDSRWVAFWTQGELRKVAVTGGPAMRLCRTVGGPRGATWTPSGTIVLATNDPTTGLLAVPAGGGDAVKLTTPAAGSDHLFPHAVGDRDEILFTIRTLNGSASEVALFDLRTKQQVVLIAGGSDAYYVDAGYIVYGAAGAVRAVRYDAAARKVSGDPVPIQDGVMTMPSSGAASYALSRAGHLLFVPGTENTQTPRRSLVWVDRQGRETPLPAEPAAYVYPRLSPDGKRLAVELREPEQDVWTLDLVRNIPARFTFDAGADGTPMWTPDGRRIIFQSSRGGAPNIYWQAADGTGPVERLTTSQTLQVPHAVTRDGKLLVFMEFTTTADLKVLRLDGRSQPETLLATEFTEGNPDLSPDDRWLVYQTNESGRFQVWVRPFPNVDSGRWQIASSGMMPVWAPNGREIFYMDGRALMSVAVETTPAFHAQKPVKLFESPYYSNSPARVFEVSRDGQRFIFVKNPSETAQPPGGRIVVVLNWLEELKAKLPAR